MEKIISGKVRDVYDINGKELVVVTTDRISAYDVILNSMIKDKGKALNLISAYWFDFTKDIIPNHLISTELKDMPEFFSSKPAEFDGRTILVKKLKMLPYEVIVRGYLFGSMWEAYKKDGSFCGIEFTGEHKLAEKLETPIITPSKKNNEGHDENVSLDSMKSDLGNELAEKICNVSLALYAKCYEDAFKKGIILADTKFEFGLDENGSLVLADEIFTPDSSRFWNAAEYRTGESPKSYDKQFVRDWLTANKLGGVTPAPELPADIVNATSALYKECYTKITGKSEY